VTNALVKNIRNFYKFFHFSPDRITHKQKAAEKTRQLFLTTQKSLRQLDFLNVLVGKLVISFVGEVIESDTLRPGLE
jgi:hypothetical protein